MEYLLSILGLGYTFKENKDSGDYFWEAEVWVGSLHALRNFSDLDITISVMKEKCLDLGTAKHMTGKHWTFAPFEFKWLKKK